MSILKRRSAKRVLRRREGFTLFEVLASLLIISVTAVGAGYGFMVGHALMQKEYRTRQVVQHMKSDMSFWMGRIHSDMPPLNYFRGQPLEKYLIDRRGPGAGDDVIARIGLDQIVTVDDIETPEDPDFWEIHIIATWEEDALNIFNPRQPKTQITLKMQAPMIRSTL